jgi:hypothetical protein
MEAGPISALERGLAAVAWARGQDPTPAFSTIVEQVMTHARESVD